MTEEKLIIDLHMHSTASDGVLSPTELVELVYENKVNVMSLTDHDTTDGLEEARYAAKQKGIKLINGVEMSASWNKKVLHIIALNIDPENRQLIEALENTKKQRLERAERIAKKLEGAGITGSLEGAKKFSNGGLITRPHFAQYLVETGKAKDPQDAFKRYLGNNKKAYVSTEWPSMEVVLDLIKQAGGIAILAHPLRYRLTASWMRRLLTSFKENGGQAMEVVCGYYTSTEIETSTSLALKFDLMGSVGSDFHGHNQYSNQPGNFPALPSSIMPVWSLLTF
ncbi:MAG: PHP domain-containing protein [Gammaproteobacteria bacterium]